MIWISGPPRSGTTMLNLMLSGRSYLPECTALTEFIRLYSLWKSDSDPRYKTFMGECKALTCSFSDIMSVCLRRMPNTAILKDPNLCLYIREWGELFPDDRMVIIIRDPRDVVSSMLTVLRKTNPSADVNQAIDVVAPHFFQIEKDVEAANNILVVRYEDVALGRQDVLNSVKSFTGVTLSSNYESAYEFDRDDSFITGLFGKPVSDERIGVHKALLNESELNRVYEIFCGIIDRRFKNTAARAVE